MHSDLFIIGALLYIVFNYLAYFQFFTIINNTSMSTFVRLRLMTFSKYKYGGINNEAHICIYIIYSLHFNFINLFLSKGMTYLKINIMALRVR